MNCGTPSASYPIVISSSSPIGRLCLLRPSVLPDSYVRVRVVSVGSWHPHRTKSGRPLCVRQSPMPISCLRGSTKNRPICYIGKTMRTHILIGSPSGKSSKRRRFASRYGRGNDNITSARTALTYVPNAMLAARSCRPSDSFGKPSVTVRSVGVKR